MTLTGGGGSRKPPAAPFSLYYTEATVEYRVDPILHEAIEDYANPAARAKRLEKRVAALEIAVNGLQAQLLIVLESLQSLSSQEGGEA